MLQLTVTFEDGSTRALSLSEARSLFDDLGAIFMRDGIPKSDAKPEPPKDDVSEFLQQQYKRR